MRAGGAEVGGTVLELLLALTLGAVVLGAFVGVLGGSLRWSESLVARAEGLEVIRTVWVVLDEELRPGIAGRDWDVDGDGVLLLRAFRGVGRICGEVEGLDRWAVAYRGRRLPDPGRDSVLVLGDDGGWRSFELTGVDDGGECGQDPSHRSLVVRWSQPSAPPPVLIRVFESGEYHLADGAFRYRRGEGGRQPLTPERLAPGSVFRRAAGSGGPLEVRVELLPGEAGGGAGLFEWSVAGTGGE